MAITSYSQLVAGLKSPVFYLKAATVGPSGTGRLITSFYFNGNPIAAPNNSSGLSGAALTSYAGAIPMPTAPAGQNNYLAAVRKIGAMDSVTSGRGYIYIVDRLWHNSGLSLTAITAQTVNSVAWPARDINGSTNGEGVYIGIEVRGTLASAANQSATISYTNSAGVSGRTSPILDVSASSAIAGSFFPIPLQAGDTGVRSIQSFTLGSSWSSGTIYLVAYRLIAAVPIQNSGRIGFSSNDAISLGMPKLYSNSVLQVFLWGSGSGSPVDGSAFSVTFSQG